MQIREGVFGGSLPSLWILREKVKLPDGNKQDEESCSFFHTYQNNTKKSCY